MRCSRFLAFLFAIATGTIGAGISLLLLTEIPRDIKEISVCVQSVKLMAHRNRSRRGFGWTSYDLWIDSRSYPRGFVHSLGMILPNRSLAQKIRQGECVVMSVDGARLSGRNAMPDELSFVFDWINDKLDPLALEITLGDQSGRVKILTLEQGPKLLISYIDSLSFRLGLLGVLALLFVGATLALLRTVIIGPTIENLEPVSYVSPEGFSLSLGSDCLTYREQGRTLRLPALQELRPERIRVYTGGIQAWAAPHQLDLLTAGEFDRILDRIEIWFSEENLNFTLDPRPGFDPAEA